MIFYHFDSKTPLFGAQKRSFFDKSMYANQGGFRSFRMGAYKGGGGSKTGYVLRTYFMDDPQRNLEKTRYASVLVRPDFTYIL